MYYITKVRTVCSFLAKSKSILWCQLIAFKRNNLACLLCKLTSVQVTIPVGGAVGGGAVARSTAGGVTLVPSGWEEDLSAGAGAGGATAAPPPQQIRVWVGLVAASGRPALCPVPTGTVTVQLVQRLGAGERGVGGRAAAQDVRGVALVQARRCRKPQTEQTVTT